MKNTLICTFESTFLLVACDKNWDTNESRISRKSLALSGVFIHSWHATSYNEAPCIFYHPIIPRHNLVICGDSDNTNVGSFA